MAASEARETRTGWFEPQTGGFSVFVPKDLPEFLPIQMDQSLWQLLSEAERGLGWLAGYGECLRSPDSFAAILLAKEAVSSSFIDGSEISLTEILWWRAEAAAGRQPQASAELRLALNYADLIRWGIERLRKEEFSTEFLQMLHTRLFEGVRGRDASPGALRTSQIWIGPPGSTIHTARYVPPLARLVPDLTDRLTAFARARASVSPLMKIAMASCQLETVFPFVDGSGRMARLMSPLMLSQERGMTPELLSLSSCFARDPTEHFFRLEQVREKGDLEGWIRYFLRGIREAVDESIAMIGSLARLRSRHRQQLKRLKGSSRSALALLDALAANPIISVHGVSQAIDRTFANANELVRRFEEEGLLREMTGRRRNRRYCYEPFIRLFT